MILQASRAAKRPHDGMIIVVEPALGRIGGTKIKQRLTSGSMTSKRLAQAIGGAVPGGSVRKHDRLLMIGFPGRETRR